MAKKFVRNITGTNLGGSKLIPNDDVTEPLYTNVQNDLLNDDEDIFIRNKEEYHCLTDNIKSVMTNNNIVGVITENKNGVTLSPKVATKLQAEEGTENGVIMTPLRTKESTEYLFPILVEPYVTVLENKINQLREDMEGEITTLETDLEVANDTINSLSTTIENMYTNEQIDDMIQQALETETEEE